MKTLQASEQQIRRERLEAMIEGRIAALFQQLPMLSGFVVQDDLVIAEVAVHSWPGHTVEADVYVRIADALSEIVEDRRDVVELLRGRTFARTLQ